MSNSWLQWPRACDRHIFAPPEPIRVPESSQDCEEERWPRPTNRPENALILGAREKDMSASVVPFTAAFPDAPWRQ
ncbi:hypothetical protein HPB48_002418 [Haemaphysalis longicornis]|uniref:Uncharacterized protein n=1 Tax=Haemaphysalis longicornis TaxID=44386 RepID=A0A9J6FDB9_HAELO|nr:hypothetical protein HPB48_002418 [Haemaphysalis longicornis]